MATVTGTLTDGVWTPWVQDMWTTAKTSTTSGTGGAWASEKGMKAWYSWHGVTTATSVPVYINYDPAWSEWNCRPEWKVAYSSDGAWGHFAYQAVESAEEKAARVLRQQAEAAQRAERVRLEEIERAARNVRLKQALDRSTELLLSILDEDNRRLYEKERKLHIISEKGERYEIDCTQNHGNVYRLNKQGKRIESLCCYQTGGTPMPDNHAAQVLALRANEELFRKTANIRELAA